MILPGVTKRVRLLSRASALALLQARLVEHALSARWPGLDVDVVSRSSAGDRDSRAALWTAADKGLFTADLSEALVRGDADAAVHSWKDLPIAAHEGTRIVATLERADPRDVLLVRRPVIAQRPLSLSVLSSSPRRAWQIKGTASRWLPWPVSDVRIAPVRGNIPTRLRKLVGGEADALIVAKAALDRLLSNDASEDARAAVRNALDKCRWMVLPIKAHPAAPAQGAVAVEVAAHRVDLVELFEAISHAATWDAVTEERRILQSFGGGCHEAVGATVLPRTYGRITSVRARVGDDEHEIWSLDRVDEPPPRAAEDRLWPRWDERGQIKRRGIEASVPPESVGFWIARAEALPEGWTVAPDRLVWAAGERTWEKLASRGIWVHGCADGLGDDEPIGVDALAGRPVTWRRLTHAAAGGERALVTYAAEEMLPADLESRSHFFWTSGSSFKRAVAAWPAIRGGWHASGPGRTARAIRETLGPDARHSVWLDYEQWLRHVSS